MRHVVPGDLLTIPGGMLLGRFASRRPTGLKKIILTNAAASKVLSAANSWSYRLALPQGTQDAMTAHEKTGTKSSPQYSAIMAQWAKDHVCNVPFPEEMLVSVGYYGQDKTVSKAMGDGGWFYPTGYMADWVGDVLEGIVSCSRLCRSSVFLGHCLTVCGTTPKAPRLHNS